MKKTTIQFLFWTAIAYAVLLFLIRGVLPADATPALTLTGIPLILIALIIFLDLYRRSTMPTQTQKPTPPKRSGVNKVRILGDQIRVAASASDSYFENIVRSRLKELLTTKASLQTGIEYDEVRRILADPDQGERFLHDPRLYALLYRPPPERGQARTRMVEEIVELIGAWKS